jgi:hypothetical protein
VKVPESYSTVLEAMPVNEVSYGVGGIKLFSAAELEQGQLGYGVAPDGKSLCSGEDGAWQPTWIAIGYETACGDPLFIETDEPTLPVLTAIHGEGYWEPMPVAISFDAFVRQINDFARIAKGRSNPVELDDNPLPDTERDSFLERVDEMNERQFDSSFWAVLLDG